jgi:hypothetical protein
LAKTHFDSKQNCQNRLKGVFAKYVIKPKLLLLKQRKTKEIYNGLIIIGDLFFLKSKKIVYSHERPNHFVN